MEKVYKVRQTVTLVMETEIEARSKAEAKWLMEEGAGDFCWGDASTSSTFKVLHEFNPDYCSCCMWIRDDGIRPDLNDDVGC